MQKEFEVDLLELSEGNPDVCASLRRGFIEFLITQGEERAHTLIKEYGKNSRIDVSRNDFLKLSLGAGSTRLNQPQTGGKYYVNELFSKKHTFLFVSDRTVDEELFATILKDSREICSAYDL